MTGPQLNDTDWITPEAVHLQSTFVGTKRFEYDDIAETETPQLLGKQTFQSAC